MLSLNRVLEPIRTELEDVQKELEELADRFAYASSREIVRRFFDAPGKLLRPALVLLSARTAATPPDPDMTARLVRACVGVELIHSASLIHDDIIDGDEERRGRPTLNREYGGRIALLMGDALYSRAFALLTETLSQELLFKVVRMNEGMCTAEIEQAHHPMLEREAYFRVIEGKTAAFMGVCCLLGASLAGASPPVAKTMERFGLLLGLAYQLFDDAADHDLPVTGLDPAAEAQVCLNEARELLHGLPASGARDQLYALCAYLGQLNSPSSYQHT